MRVMAKIDSFTLDMAEEEEEEVILLYSRKLTEVTDIDWQVYIEKVRYEKLGKVPQKKYNDIETITSSWKIK